MSNRREFLGRALTAGAGLAALGAGPLRGEGTAAHGAGPQNGVADLGAGRMGERSGHPLNILILGGTSFIGPHQIAYALGRGHSITTFTRGQTRPTVHARLMRDVEQLTGDREGDLDALRDRRWDAVIDNSGRRVEWTRESAELLKDSVDLYVYTSSTGVYYPYLGSNIGEDTEVAMNVPPDLEEERQGAYGYGVMKAQSERAARDIFGDDRTIVVRPTYIMGPGDGTDRFTYWPIRLSVGGEVLVPGRAEDPVQYIDVRDLSSWMIRLIENRTAGTFNAVGPASETGMHAFVHGAHAAFKSPASFVKVTDHDFLATHGVLYSIPWIMPVGDNAGSARIDHRHAVQNGLTYTPLAESVRDTHDWWHSGVIPEDRMTNLLEGPRSLMSREPAVIEAWKRR